MSVTVRLPGALRAHVGGQAVVVVDAGPAPTVRAVLDTLEDRHPALVRRLRDERGGLRRFVNVYVGELDVRDAQGLETLVGEGAEMLVLPSVAGG